MTNWQEKWYKENVWYRKENTPMARIACWAEDEKGIEVYDISKECITFTLGYKYTVVVEKVGDGFKCYTWRRDKEGGKDTNHKKYKTERGVRNYIYKWTIKGAYELANK